MSNSTWPAYQLFIRSAQTLAKNADVSRENAGAGLFAVAMEVLADEWGNAELARWLRVQLESIERMPPRPTHPPESA